MPLFDLHHNHDEEPARPKARRFGLADIGEMLAIVIVQNETMLAKQEKRPSRISHEDQAAYDQIFEKVVVKGK